MTKSPFASFLILGLLSLSGTFLILYATPQGLGLFDDSIAYIAGARSILNGDGYRAIWLASSKPVTHFPPMFSSVLALIGLSGLDPLRGTRFVNSLLFGGNIFLLGIIGWKMTKSQIAGVVLAILFLANASMFRVHSNAMSEPLYIFLTLASFLTFYFYFELKQRRWLILTGCLVGGAYLTRYAGLSLFTTFLVSLVLLQNTWKDRLSHSAIFILSFIPFALGWSIRNQIVAENATNRTFVYHPIAQENITIGISVFSEFLMPFNEWRRELIRTPNLVPSIIFILLLIMFVWFVTKGLKKFLKPTTQTPEVLSFISVLYIFGYLASLILSMTFFDASTKFQLRILSPIFVSLLIVFVYFLNWLFKRQKYLASFAFLFIFAFSIYGITKEITQLRKGGVGYASFQWFDSDAMEFLRNLPEGTRIYTNEAAAVYLYTNRGAYVLPDLIDPVTGQERGGFEEGVSRLQAEVLSGNAVLVLFDVSKDVDRQAIYQILSEGLYLAFDKQNDTIYTAYP